MPKIVMYYDSNVIRLSADSLKDMGRHMAKYVAVVMSTRDRRISPSTDVDFIPLPYPDGYIGLTISIEIETIGYLDRKTKVTASEARALKSAIIELLKQNGIGFDERNPLVWIKYFDPDGHFI